MREDNAWVEGYAEGYRRGVAASAAGAMMRCPGCGDLGDAAHVGACMTGRDAAKLVRAVEFAIEKTLEVAGKQISRRGIIDHARTTWAVLVAWRRAAMSGGPPRTR